MDLFRLKGQKGFTLIELLVVISITALLSSISLANLNTARDKARINLGQQYEANMFHAYAANAIAMWGFDEASGSVLIDSTGKYNAQYYTGVTRTSSGISGGALVFNNDDGTYLNDKLATRLDIIGGASGKILFTAWVKPTNFHAVGRSITFGWPGIGFIYLNGSGKVIMNFGGSPSAYSLTSNASLPLNQWSYIGVLVEGGIGTKIFIDGKLDNLIANSALITATGVSPLAFTVISGQNASFNFQGTMDSVRVYDASI